MEENKELTPEQIRIMYLEEAIDAFLDEYEVLGDPKLPGELDFCVGMMRDKR